MVSPFLNIHVPRLRRIEKREGSFYLDVSSLSGVIEVYCLNNSSLPMEERGKMERRTSHILNVLIFLSAVKVWHQPDLLIFEERRKNQKRETIFFLERPNLPITCLLSKRWYVCKRAPALLHNIVPLCLIKGKGMKGTGFHNHC